uniref:lactosylceramide 1,3-N-acetyl-beta-D-glucosaminyltransferase A-like n=1 Tax=Styela clava TaxID=7725 RepID=UPI00193A2A5C|nr:lactosylceramide 1,3-N-acetyl-beta-D-glucosaminyltransferase A-like [Styela clava]
MQIYCRCPTRVKFTYLFCFSLTLCLVLKIAIYMSSPPVTKQNIAKYFEATSNKLTLLAHKYNCEAIDEFLKNGTTPREHLEFLAKPWRINVSASPASLFHNNNVVELWSSIAVVKSSIMNENRRFAIRETWGKFKFIDGVRLETVFILGTTDDIQLQKEIIEENGIYGDILQVDLPDTKENVPAKTLAGMRWISQNIPDTWLYSSVDDDFILHPPNFIRYVESVKRDRISKTLPIMCIYAYRKAEEINRKRGSPWYISPEQYAAKNWPPYCRGGWYTMPTETASKLYEISRTTPFLKLDDVWITGIIRLIMNDRENKPVPPGSHVSEYGITFAPLADRTNNQLYYNQYENDLGKVIVSHTWSGNYGLFAHSIENDIENIWSKWETAVLERMKYYIQAI